jgi:hypothetical protein
VFLAFVSLLATAAIEVNERDVAVLVVVAPKGSTEDARVREIAGSAARALAAKTSLALRLENIDRCGGADRLSCWVHAVRPDCAVAAECTRLARPVGPQATPRMLFVVALNADESGIDHLSVMMIDTDEALASEGRIAHTGEGWETRVENAIFEGVVVGPPGSAERADPESLDRYFGQLVQGPFSPKLEAAGAWEPYGAIAIDGASEGAAIELDGRRVGVAPAARTELRGVKPGSRSVAVLGGEAGARIVLPPVEVRTQAVATVRVPAGVSPHSEVSARDGLLFGGLGVAAAGGVITLVSALARGDRALEACFGACGSAPRRSFTTVGPLLAAPLGYSLIATGTAWSLGAWLDDDDYPLWLPLAAGVVLGAATYGLSATLNGRSP